MPKHVGKKYRTVHKFGKRRKKRKSQDQSSETLVKQSAAEPSATTTSTSAAPSEFEDDAVPSTSSDPQSSVASGRKMAYFKPQKRKFDSSDDDSDGTERTEPVEEATQIAVEEGAEIDTPTSPDMNLIVNLACLQTLITASSILCPECKEPRLTVIEGGKEFRKGSACLLELRCTECGKLSAEWTSQKTGIIHTGYDINRRLVAAATTTGLSFSQTKRFFALMGMPPPMSEPTWYFYKSKLHLGAKRAADKHLQEAANQVRKTYADMNIGIPDNNGILNISISIDGSWQKRGRTSHNGLVTAIDIITGLIIDFVALSNYCQICESGPKPGDVNYEEWSNKHRGKCQKNVNCSSPAMEMEGAEIMFKRSVDLHGFRYVEMLGDGDSKTYKRLTDVDPYNGYPIEKIECINHVTKRMGTALRTLVEKRKAQKQPIGGRGRLTEARIKQLTNYYGRAIKDNSGDLEAMEQAVWASFLHTLSSDDSHNHSYCPDGTSSWCFFKRAVADNVAPRQHRHPLPAEIGEALKPVYQRLGDPQLLRRCLAGKTQNSNESFHSLMWTVCPKERWASLRTVDTALAITVQKFNQGSSALLNILVELELLTSPSEEYVEKEDFSRVQSATRRSSKKEQERRKTIEDIRRQERQEQQEREGLVYGAGEF